MLHDGVLVPLEASDPDAGRLSNALVPFDLNNNAADFKGKVREHLLSVMDASAIEKVFKDGLDAVLALPLISTQLPNGISAQELRITDHFSLYFDASGKLIARKKDGRVGVGKFAMTSDKRFGLLSGTIYADFSEDWSVQAIIRGGMLTEISAEKQGELQVEIKSQDGDRIIVDANFVIQKGEIVFQGRSRAILTGGKVLSIAQKLSQMAQSIFSPLNQNVETGEMTYFLNGIGNSSTTTAPDYASAFRDELASHMGFDLDHIELVPLYFGTDVVTGTLQYLQQFQTASTQNEQLAIDAIQRDLESGVLQEWDMINVVAYSGGGQVFLEAIQNAGLHVRVNLVTVGAPLFEPTLSSKIESFQFLYGNLDMTLPIALLFSPINFSYCLQMIFRNRPFDIEMFQGFEHAALGEHDHSYFSHENYTWQTYSGTYLGFLTDRIVNFLT